MSNQDSSSLIASNAKRFFSGTMASRATGLAREVIMAAVFGTNATTAAFWMALRFALLLRRVFGEGALNTAFVPHFEHLKNKDPAHAARFFYDLSVGTSLILFLLIFLVEGALGVSLAFWPMNAATTEVVRLSMILLPSIAFISLFALNSSLLNCEGSFLLPSSAPSVLNIVWIGAIFLVLHYPQQRALELLSMFLVAAFALQWAVTLFKVIPYLSKGLEKKRGFSYKEIVHILRPFTLSVVGVTAMQINSGLDSLFARIADLEGPAYLWYALRLQQLPLALIGVGLTGALLPPISRAIERGQRANYLHFLNFALKNALILLLPISAAIVVLGLSGINLVYGHGHFSNLAIIETARCLWAYGAALLPMTMVLILASAFYAHKNYRLPTLISLASVLLNIILNALFVFLFHWGAVSVAIATTISSCVNALWLGLALRRSYGVDLHLLGLIALKTALASLIAAVITLWLGAHFFHDNTSIVLQGGTYVVFPKAFFAQLASFSIQALLFASSFATAAYLLGLQKQFFLKFSKNTTTQNSH